MAKLHRFETYNINEGAVKAMLQDIVDLAVQKLQYWIGEPNEYDKSEDKWSYVMEQLPTFIEKFCNKQQSDFIMANGDGVVSAIHQALEDGNVDEARKSFTDFPYQMYYSLDNIASADGAKTEKELIDLAKKKKVKAFAIFKAGQGFHSTTQEEFLVSWYDSTGHDYWSNRSKNEPDLKKKKIDSLNEGELNEAVKAYNKEVVKHKWFETGSGTMFTNKQGLIGFVYELDGKWIALGGLDEEDGKKALRELANGKISPSRGWSATLDSFEEAEQELVGDVLNMHDLQMVAKTLKFPSGAGRKEYGDSIKWTKRGGHAGDKTVYGVLGKAKELKWKETDGKSSNNATGDVVSNTTTYVDPTGKYQISGYAKYGVTVHDNWYELTLKTTDKK